MLVGSTSNFSRFRRLKPIDSDVAPQPSFVFGLIPGDGLMANPKNHGFHAEARRSAEGAENHRDEH
jgi:hypothetical protein